jgi:multisubunit Na+/H+ antiporter MnhG subunit
MMVAGFVLSTNPTATHAMVKAALHDGQTPLVKDEDNMDTDATEEDSSTS